MAERTLVGCCGWQQARARYFQQFPVIEIQDTFYEPPTVELAAQWRREAPPGFRFAMKAWQLITHGAGSPTYRRLKTPIAEIDRAAFGSFQPTAQVWEAWQRTLAVARALDAAAIVFQCPASFRPTAENQANLGRFFSRIERKGLLIAWEARGAWQPEQVRVLCERLDLVDCVDPFQREPTWGRQAYFRLHGRGGYRYSYTDDELAWLRELCLRQAETGRYPIYAMFNNVEMKKDAARFAILVAC